MTAFERLLTLADEETICMARKLIGREKLALLLAKSALAATSKVLSPSVAAEVLEMTPRGARDKIDKASVSEIVGGKIVQLQG